MADLVNERADFTKKADTLENDIVDLNDRTTANDKKVTELEKEISKTENGFDDAMTATVNAHEKLEVANKTASDRELEVSALARQVQLLQETIKVTQERLDEVLEKLPVVEKNLEENERTRKVFEAKSFQNEEKAELQEGQLIDAVQIAEDSNRKFDDVQRKLKMVEDELNAKVEKAEEYESKISAYESTLAGDTKKLKELEELASANGQKEDESEVEVGRLLEELKTQETRAEFGERTVEKLEGGIDNLTDMLFEEKLAYRDMSLKLDATLNDMMGL